MAQSALVPETQINGFHTAAMGELVQKVSADPKAAVAGFRVRSIWRGGAKVESQVKACELGGQTIARRHTIHSDEPAQLLGTDSAPNPQELLFAALNGCMIFGYTAKAAALGIHVDDISVETAGDLDVRGALGLAPVPPGMLTIEYTVHVKARATDEQIQALHEAVIASSPNRFHLTQPLELVPTLVIDRG